MTSRKFSVGDKVLTTGAGRIKALPSQSGTVTRVSDCSVFVAMHGTIVEEGFVPDEVRVVADEEASGVPREFLVVTETPEAW